jgi:hypothetical protein
LRNPKKQLPLSINTAIPTIILCYVAANAVYYILLPWKLVSTTDAAAVVSLRFSKPLPILNRGQTAVNHLLGKGGAYAATILICLVIAGSQLGNSFVAGRMTVAAANKKWFPALFGTVGQIGTYRVSKSTENDASAEDAMDQGESPMYVPCEFSMLRTLTIPQQLPRAQLRDLIGLHSAWQHAHPLDLEWTCGVHILLSDRAWSHHLAIP